MSLRHLSRRALLGGALSLAGGLPLLAAENGDARFAPRLRGPVSLILDTDIGPDVDDVGAVAILHALADRGEAHILAMNCCTSSEWGAPCLDALNTYYGRPDIPVGTLKGRPGYLTQSAYNRQVAEAGKHSLRHGADAPDAVAVYRRVLAKQRDGSVTLCATGPLTNLAALLQSEPDQYSPLSGLDLARRKVRLLSVMGGRFPTGKEWNWEQDPPAASQVMRLWPSPVLCSGFEIGMRIFTGKRLHAETPAGNPVRAAYALFPGVEKDRESWDETAVLAAVRGPASHWTLRSGGTITVDPKTAEDTWADTPDGKHAFLVERDPPATVKKAIEDLMVAPPRHR